jgi:hypothetical protein
VSDTEIRARWPKKIGEWYDANRPNEWQAARVALGDRWETIEKAYPSDWISHADYRTMLHALAYGVTPEQFHEMFAEASESALELPWFDSMISALVRLAGRRALGMGLPRIWQMLHRNAGKVEVIQEPNQGSTVRFYETPTSLTSDQVYVRSLAAAMLATMRRAGFVGTVSIDDEDAAKGELRLHMVAESGPEPEGVHEGEEPAS